MSKGWLDKMNKGLCDRICRVSKELMEPENLLNSLWNVWEAIKNPLQTWKAVYEWVKKLILNLNEMIEEVEYLPAYEKSIWVSYGGTMVWLLIADPASKYMRLRICKVEEIYYYAKRYDEIVMNKEIYEIIYNIVNNREDEVI